jgi:hypothetical protein
MTILLGDFNAKARRKDILKPAIRKENTHDTGNENGVRVLNFATSKDSVVRSTMISHRKIHKYTWTSPEEKTHNQIDHVLIYRRRRSTVLYAQSFRGADCDTDHNLVVENVRKGLAVSKRTAQKIDNERFNVKNIKEGEVKEQNQVTNRNKFAALENLADSGEINRTWNNIR